VAFLAGGDGGGKLPDRSSGERREHNTASATTGAGGPATISSNSNVIDSRSFTDLASAEAFFSNNLIGSQWLAVSNLCLMKR
jgi:hypothetical protein